MTSPFLSEIRAGTEQVNNFTAFVKEKPVDRVDLRMRTKDGFLIAVVADTITDARAMVKDILPQRYRSFAEKMRVKFNKKGEGHAKAH